MMERECVFMSQRQIKGSIVIRGRMADTAQHHVGTETNVNISFRLKGTAESTLKHLLLPLLR